MADPAHPYADLMADVVALARKVTQAVREDTPEGRRLHDYLAVCGLLTHDEDGKHPTLICLRGVYCVLRLAGETKALTERSLLHRYSAASGGWVPPLHARRRKAKGGSPNGKVVDL